MLKDAFEVRKIRASYIAFDSWYASVANLKYIHRHGRIFYTTLKSDRLVSLSKEEGYIHLDMIEWTPERLQNGIAVKLKEVPFLVKLFKLVAKDGDIEWVITNDPATDLTITIVRGRNDVRWDVECCRELKQLTGIEVPMSERMVATQPYCLLLPRMACIKSACHRTKEDALPCET